MNSHEYSRHEHEIAGWPCVIETYRVGEVYHCTVANADPGARIARADGASRDEAEQRAIEKAAHYLSKTRRFPAR